MNNPAQIKRFIFTSAPGSGKTSVIMGLEKLGHTVIHEAATDVNAFKQSKGIEYNGLKNLDKKEGSFVSEYR